jgi:hypothetical protein
MMDEITERIDEERHPYEARVHKVHDIVVEDTTEQIVKLLLHKNPSEFWDAVKKAAGVKYIWLSLEDFDAK